MAASRSAAGVRPCTRPTRAGASSRSSSSATIWTLAHSPASSEGSMSGQTTNARAPAASARRSVSRAERRPAAPVMTLVTGGVRPGGSSSSVVTSRSP